MKAASTITVAVRASRQFVQGLVLLALLATLLPSLTAQAPPPTITVTPTPTTLIEPVTGVNELVAGRFRISFDNPAINQEAMQKGVKSQTYVITFGDMPKDGGVLSTVTLKTAKGNIDLFKGKLAAGGFSLAMNSPSQWTITGTNGSLLPREIDIVGRFTTPGSKTVTLAVSVTPLSGTAASTGQGKAVGTIIAQGTETLFLRDLSSNNFASDPPGTDPKAPLLVLAGPNRRGSIEFGIAAPDKAANVKYNWTLKRSIDTEPFRSGVFPRQVPETSFPYLDRLTDLPRATYTLTLTKTVEGKAVPFTRKIDFRILAVELNIEGVPLAAKLEPGAFIPLNGGNVNGSKTTFGIPEKYDFEMNPLPKNSLLVKATFVIGEEGSPPQGITGFRLSAQNKGRARIRIWDTARKQNEIILPKQFGPNDLKTGSTIWIEGVKEGATEREVALTFEMLRGTQVLSSDTTLITVTPVLEQLLADPGTGTAPDLVDDVAIGGIALDSMVGKKMEASMTLTAKVLRTNLPAKSQLKLVQFTRNLNNLPGGGGADVGPGTKFTWDFAGVNARNWLVDSTAGQFPFYDGRPVDDTPDPNLSRHRDVDSPELPVGPNNIKTTSVLPPAGKITAIDVTFRYDTFAVWVYPDGSVYFLGRMEWFIRFAGTTRPDPMAKLKFSFAPATTNQNTGNKGIFVRDNDKHTDSSKPQIVREPVAAGANANWR